MRKLFLVIALFILFPLQAYTGPVLLGFDAEIGLLGVDRISNPFSVRITPSISYLYRRWQFGADASMGLNFGSAGTEVNYFIKPKKARLRYIGLTVDHIFFGGSTGSEYVSADGFAFGFHSGHTKLLNKHHLYMSSCTGFKVGYLKGREENSAHGSVYYTPWDTPVVYLYINIGLRKGL
jgi:hypothetical protein